MSSLDKLLISGIRSFNPKDKQTVTFFHPLTLIVGHNGAGKTSIIEALKYACTGEQPLHTTGGKFICDPKMCGETEVKGQVKLKFTNVSGREVVCTRSLQVTQTPNSDTLRSKTLESLLLVKDPNSGRTYALSSTCAEINEELPNHLGVSKPILENVIFCHQEESFWPLSEPRVLKVKFDEIFAATRYTKALENLKSIRKKTMAEMGGMKVQVAHDKENTNRAVKHRKQLERLEGDADARRERIAELDGPTGEIAIVMQELATLMNSMQESSQIKNKIHSYTLEKDMLEKNAQALAANTTILNETDEELEKKLERFVQSVSKQANDQESLDREKEQLNQQYGAVQKQLSDLFASKGRFEAENQAHLAHVAERALITRELILKHKFAEFDSSHDLPEYKITSFINRLNEEYNKKVSEVKSFKAEAKEKEAVIMSELQKTTSNLSALEEKKRMTRRQSDQCTTKITNLTREMQSMSNTANQLENVDENIQKYSAKIESEKRALEQLSSSNGSSTLGEELQTFERRAQGIRDEMSVLSSQGDTRARLGIKQTDKKRKSESYNKLLVMMKSECETLLKKTFRQETVQNDLEDLIGRQERAVKSLRDQKIAKISSSAGIDAKLALLRQSVQSKSEELDQKQRKITDVCGETDFPLTLKSAVSSVETIQEQMNSMKSVGLMYNKFILKFQKEKCCSLCSRGFHDVNEEKAFFSQMNDVVSNVPRRTEQLDVLLGQAKTRVQELKKLEGLWNDCERLANTEIPELRKSRDALEREKASQFSSAEDLDSEICIVEAEVHHSYNLKNRSQEAATLWKDISHLEREISSIEVGLGSTGVGRNMDTVQEEYDGVQKQCKALRNKMDRANSEFKIKNQEISILETKLRDFRGEKQRIEFQVQEKDRIKQAITDIQSENEKLSRDILDIESQISQLPRQIDQFKLNLRTLQAQSNRDDEVVGKDIQALSNSVNKITSAQEVIERYNNGRKAEQLQNCKNQITDLEGSLKNIAREKDLVVTKLEDLTKEVSQIQLTQRNIADNLQLRKFKGDKIKLENKIVSMKRDLQKYERENIGTQLQTLQSRQEELVSERAEAMGSLRQLEESVKELKKLLDSDFKNIEKQYAENKFKYMVDELAMNDLEKYAKALEQAIMTFHAKKMQEINKIIRELWTKTYKGSDIDTIEIRSDPESKANNRSFNYRVVMISNDVEMDMRGRCSAGQKVIASIIIRLALAETFCLQCGILALDEPTTNLDNENISGLAQALADIIATREKQSNFQLIIITHDEAFVQALGRSEHANSYFRVEKAGGFSTIKQYAIINDQEE